MVCSARPSLFWYAGPVRQMRACAPGRRYPIAAGVRASDYWLLSAASVPDESGPVTDGQYRLPLKLPRCEFGHDLVNGAGFADQQQRRRNRFGYFLFGRPFCPRRIERDAISIAHNRTYPGWPVQRATKSPARRGPRQDRGSYPRDTPLLARRDERGVRLFSPEASATASPSTSVSPETARLSSSRPARSAAFEAA